MTVLVDDFTDGPAADSFTTYNPPTTNVQSTNRPDLSTRHERTLNPYEYERPEIKYFPVQKPYDNARPVKAIIVGAGKGGTAAALLLSKKVHNITLDVYDRQSKIGGTWALNRYPGVRCDVPSHAYQLSFAPNTQWTEYYPKGSEIQKYYENTVKEWGLFDRFHLKHEVLKAFWLENQFEWLVDIKNTETGDIFQERADFFISAQGRISVPKWPQIEGLHTIFKGDVVHTAKWKKDLNITDKRVAVIGNGASGQQIIPNIISKVKHLDHYVRTKTWVTATFAKDLFEATAEAPGGPKFTPEELELFRTDRKAYLQFRQKLELSFQSRTGAEILGSKENQELRHRIVGTMLKRIGGDEKTLATFLPDYAPGCKRLTPAPGYLEALTHSKVDYLTEGILRVDETGIWTKDGKHHQVDVIITATGFENGFTTLFPVLGLGGVDLKEKWSRNGPIGYPESYLGLAAPGFPNYFTILQAQGNARGGTVPLQIEIASTFIAKAIRKIQSQSYLALHPSEEATTEFNDIVNGYFDDKVQNDSCNSWFKQGIGHSRNLIGWPGSYFHRADAIREPRWEDFQFIRQHKARRNRFEYFGNGLTPRDFIRDDSSTLTYLKEIPDPALAHEYWNL